MKAQNLLRTALVGALTLGAASIVTAAPAPANMGSMSMTPQQIQAQQAKTMKMMKTDHLVQCYGINAANKNDCKSPGHSCAGQDSNARDPNAFVAVPAGLCAKIAGGSSSPAQQS